jgi:hypothetical protein
VGLSPRLRGHPKRQQRRHSIVLAQTTQEEAAIQSAAFDALPASLGQLFADYQAASKGTNRQQKRAVLIEQLNAAALHAMSVQDTIGLDCQEQKANITNELRNMRAQLASTESNIALAQDRAQSIQAGLDRAEAATRRARSQSAKHTTECAEQKKQEDWTIGNLTLDKPKALDLVSQVTADCASGSGDPPPLLIECTMPDGSIIPTFKDQSFRVLGAGLGESAEHFLYWNLDVALHQAQSATSLLGMRSHVRQLRHGRRHRRLRRALPDVASVDAEKKCTDVAVAPTCSGFLDSMANFQGALENAIQDAQQRKHDAIVHCDNTVSDYRSLMTTLNRQADTSNEAIASWTAEESFYVGLERTQRRQVDDLAEEAKRGAKQCAARLSSAAEATVAAERMWQFLQASGSTGTFIGDCEVTHWVVGSCTKPCGEGGKRNYTRRAIWKPSTQGQQCPSLLMTRPCNEKPCPVDGKVDQWRDWSECSKFCGGGIRTRLREIIREPQYGGLPNPETVQQEVCNVQSCEADCELLDWTKWSNCSKACDGGHQTRMRNVKFPAALRGHCPEQDHPLRLEARACNSTASTSCTVADKAAHCASPLDIVVILDGSGSIGDDGFTHAKSFVKDVVTRAGLGQQGANTRMGIISFSGSAQVVQDLVADATKISDKLTALAWPASSGNATARGSNAAAAFALARSMLERRSNPFSARAVAVALTDGTVTSRRLLDSEVQKLKKFGTRMTFVAPGPGSARRVKAWASWPDSENIVSARSYKTLPVAQKVTELLANICPVLSFK